MAEQLKLFNRDESQGKKCTKCGKWKIFDDFYKEKRGKYGRASKCKECIDKNVRLYQQRPEIRDRIKARQKIYEQRPDIKAKIKARKKTYNQRPDIKDQAKTREKVYQQNPEIRARRKEYIKKYQQKSENKARCKKQRQKPEIKARTKAYRQGPENKERRNKKHRERIKKDLKYKLNRSMSSCICKSLKGKKNGHKWLDLVPYTIDDLTKRLKKTLPKGYAWEDFTKGKGVLHIDHIIPMSAHNFKTPVDEDFHRCWALKNLQLLPAKENMSKNAKLTKHFQPSLRIAL